MKPATFYREMAKRSKANAREFLNTLEKEIEARAKAGHFVTEPIRFPDNIDVDYVCDALTELEFSITRICAGIVVSWKKKPKSETEIQKPIE